MTLSLQLVQVCILNFIFKAVFRTNIVICSYMQLQIDDYFWVGVIIDIIIEKL